MPEFPPKLVLRNPRDSQHIAAAHKIITTLAPITVTQKTEREIRSTLGAADAAQLMNGITITPRIPAGDTLIICSFFFLESGWMFADNVIVQCADCNAALQLRPEGLAAATKLCVFCAADRMLAEQHAKHPVAQPNAPSRKRSRPKKR